MVDGASVLAQMMWSMRSQGAWIDERGTNLLDGGAPFYDTYECADGGHVAVGCIEPQFYTQLLAGLGLDPIGLPAQLDQSGWPTLRAAFSEVFGSRPRAHWEKVFEGTDACVTPVLTFTEAAAQPHLAARRTLIDLDGALQPAPAPRFSRTAPELPAPPPAPGAHTDAISHDWAI